MASSENGEYSLNTVTEVHTNTQDNDQAEGPRWLPGEVTTSTSTVEYQEGAGAIGGPSSVNEERVMQDDLILKYNFQESGTGPVPPTPTGLVLNFSVENGETHQPGGGTLNLTMLDDVPEGTELIVYHACCVCSVNTLTVNNSDQQYCKEVIVSPDEGLETLKWCYCPTGGSWQELGDGTVLAANGMAVKAIVYSET